ncbi:S8 family serine peptidase [Streptomyces sp. DSM 44917]|uniref:S8 family serine peptidase n=1 Tax=Streptomyces boetiae TaxID=3075541 RepID=A0ABU2L472_9ACTN|nr:S8 family serine peptidase [Streptomyces sp. DSM 44917]MDT0306366.1 S8 family serine peptidase [Streptomyces sp. DSM 44917]
MARWFAGARGRLRGGAALAVPVAGAVLWAGAAVPAGAVEDVERPWYLGALRAEDVWEVARGQGVTVAVIDSGVDASLPELRGRVLPGVDLTDGRSGAGVDATGHGTDMAALIAGSGAGGGIQGLAPEASILPVRLTESAGGVLSNGEARMAQAILAAVEGGARVINISRGGRDRGFGVPEVNAALAEAARRDVLVFASTGNEGEGGNASEFPASRPGVVGIGAVGPDAERAPFSTFGPQVALAAPGTDMPGHCEWPDASVLCVFPEGGTSSATAVASAAAALVWSAHPEWTKNQVLRALIETAQRPEGGDGRDQHTGFGMVRPDRVLLGGGAEPGEADVNPLFAEFEAVLAPPPSPSPSPSSSPSPERPPAPALAREPRPRAEPGRPWLLWGGAGAASLAVAATAVALSRRRS